MRARLRNLWESRAPRERLLITVLLIVLGSALYLWLAQSAHQARTRLHSSVPMLRTQAGNFEKQASEYERLPVVPSPSLPSDLRSLVQAQADIAGISHTLTGIDAVGADQVRVVFHAVPFADWLGWVSTMQLQHVRFNSGRIEAMPEPGVVNVTATFIVAE